MRELEYSLMLATLPVIAVQPLSTVLAGNQIPAEYG